MDKLLSQAVSVGELRLFDIQFARRIAEANGGAVVDELTLASALVSYRLSLGDTCVDLEKVASFGLFSHPDIESDLQHIPAVRHWRDVLLDQPVVLAETAAEQGSDSHADNKTLFAPLILDNRNRLYLSRYWRFEKSLLGVLQDMIDAPSPTIDKQILNRELTRHFGDSGDPDWQRVATAVAAIKRFCVITGGPGTGKTYTVAAVLAVLDALHGDGYPLKVALAAPTGKAAARLTESLRASAIVPAKYRELEAVTLHRLLGLLPGKLLPRYREDNPLPHDVVIIDEASMIDLPLMVRALTAVSPQARIILLGDKDQLASVESGMVLGDICGLHTTTQLSKKACKELQNTAGIRIEPSGVSAAPIADHIIYLGKSHRSDDQSGISALSQAINEGDVNTCLGLLACDEYPSLQVLDHTTRNIEQVLMQQVVPGYEALMAVDDPVLALEKMSKISVLCALRRGRSGADGINSRVKVMLRESSAAVADAMNYHGRPVLITENNAAQNLFNGDYGITWEHDGELKVCFQGEAGVRVIAPSRLPRHETFYAMTVHKSQGSEYDSVVVILPESDNPLLNRELLYTAVTRARKKVTLIANPEQLTTAIRARAQRQSGILGALWPGVKREIEIISEFGKKPVFDGIPVQTELDI